MKKLLPALLLTLVVLVAFAAGVAVGLGQPPNALFAAVVENATGETVEAKVGGYARALFRGDERAALAAWDIGDLQMSGQQRSQALSDRRQRITGELIAAHVRRDYQILNIQWWGTCCEPRVIMSSRNAGGARVDVQFLDEAGNPLLYRFDVFTRGGPYWADALGYPPRQWALRDIYPAEAQPLFWTLVSESTVRSVNTP